MGQKNSNLTCSCVIPTAAIIVLAIVGAAVALAVNNVQIGFCAVPSERFMNPGACVELFKNARTLYALGGGFFGAFAGLIIGLTSIFIFGPRSS